MGLIYNVEAQAAANIRWVPAVLYMDKFKACFV
jgi:hypothetical protein